MQRAAAEGKLLSCSWTQLIWEAQHEAHSLTLNLHQVQAKWHRHVSPICYSQPLKPTTCLYIK